MDSGGPLFVLAIIAMPTGGWAVSTWIRARHGYPVENERGRMARPLPPAQLTDCRGADRCSIS
jgi:hypothetical protein